MKIITVTLPQYQVDYMRDNCIIISAFFRQKIDKLIENSDKFDKV